MSSFQSPSAASSFGAVDPVRREQAGGGGFGGQVGVKAEHDVGIGVFAFELHAVQQRDAIGDARRISDRSRTFSQKPFQSVGPDPIRR